ncbi:metal-dependent hydrolase, partial [Pseudomonas sp. MPR-R1B]
LKAALAWAEGKAAWIAAQRARLPQALPFEPGARIPFGDGHVTILWDEAAPRRVERDGSNLRCGGTRDGLSRRVALWLKREALR